LIEARWQASWEHRQAFAVTSPSDQREPAYVLVPCPLTLGDANMGQVRSYTIADAYARFMRARGRAVLFSLGFDSFGLSQKLGTLPKGVSPREWVKRCCERMRGQFERLGYSFDWERASDSSEPEHYRWTQWLFLAMLERDLVYRGEAQWYMRITAYAQQNERDLEELARWSDAAIRSQRTALGRLEGVELDANTFDGASLTVFTHHPEAIPDAAFIAVSPAHPDIDRWIAEPQQAAELAALRAGSRGENWANDQIPLLQPGVLATVSGVAGLLPIVISPLVDARFGPTAVLGIPKVDPVDGSIAERLPAPSGGAWKASRSRATPRPAVRYRVCDLPVSREGAWGAPIPLVHCPACGTVPVPVEDLPVRLPEDLEITGETGNALARRPDFYECACPRCHGQAKRETDTIDCHIDEMWMWMSVCVPPEDRSSAMFSHPECARWLPAEQIVSGTDAAGHVFDQRVMGKLLQDLGELPALPGREPFAKALMPETIHSAGGTLGETHDDTLDPGVLVEDVGADTVRLAVLYAASPGRAFNWNDQAARYCRGFLEKLYAYAEPRLREWGSGVEGEAQIDTRERLRRRLANWCSVARKKASGHLERLEMHRAADDAIRLLARIQDFERRTLQRRLGELEDADREAVVAALLLLVQMLAPLAPHIAEELWSLAGHETLVSNAPWPEEPARVAALDTPATNGGEA
jgi:leucyl-tRNA synthetase